jgi:hypothetical protein
VNPIDDGNGARSPMKANERDVPCGWSLSARCRSSPGLVNAQGTVGAVEAERKASADPDKRRSGFAERSAARVRREPIGEAAPRAWRQWPRGGAASGQISQL